MQLTQFASIALLFAPALAKVSNVQNPQAAGSVPAPAKSKFNDDATDNLLFTPDAAAAADESVIPDYIFVVQCLEQGFRGDCKVLGAPPGVCVSYASFGDDINTKYHNEVASLSTNTGGVCQFYHYEDCNEDGDDGGVTLSYAYDLCKSESGNTRPDDYSGDYCHNITSWRC